MAGLSPHGPAHRRSSISSAVRAAPALVSFSYPKTGEGSPKRALPAACGKRLFWGSAESFLQPELQPCLVVTGKEQALPRTKLTTADFSEAAAGLKEIGIS